MSWRQLQQMVNQATTLKIKNIAKRNSIFSIEEESEGKCDSQLSETRDLTSQIAQLQKQEERVWENKANHRYTKPQTNHIHPPFLYRQTTEQKPTWESKHPFKQYQKPIFVRNRQEVSPIGKKMLVRQLKTINDKIQQKKLSSEQLEHLNSMLSALSGMINYM